jgi:hypothetical protein
VIDRIIAECPAEYNIVIKFFDCSLFRAIPLNWWQYFKNGKNIPLDIILSLKESYDGIDRRKYCYLAYGMKITHKHY